MRTLLSTSGLLVFSVSAALHAQAEADANELLGRVQAEADPATAFVGSFGSVMVVHTGPGLVGLAWRWEPIV